MLVMFSDRFQPVNKYIDEQRNNVSNFFDLVSQHTTLSISMSYGWMFNGLHSGIVAHVFYFSNVCLCVGLCNSLSHI